MIQLTRRAAQIMELAVLTDPTLEVSGFGRGVVREGIIEVDDIMIPPQDVGGAHTDVEDENLIEWLSALAAEGMLLKDWPVWWHSHCSMGVSPSGQDTSTLALLARSVPNLGWFAGIVTNVRGEYHGWLKTMYPVELDAKLNVYVETPPPEEGIIDTVKKMMEGVKKKTYPVYKGAPYQQGGYYGQGAEGGGQSRLPMKAQPLSRDTGMWDAWVSDHGEQLGKRLRDMSPDALGGLRKIFGSEAMNALLKSNEDVLVVAGGGGGGTP